MNDRISMRYDIDTLEDQLFVPWNTGVFELRDFLDVTLKSAPVDLKLIRVDVVERGFFLRFNQRGTE